MRDVAAAAQAQTVFPGGDLDALRALSPALTFDQLVIDGPLTLSPFDDPVLQVAELTISPGGSVGYSQGTCDWLAGPSFTVLASGAVTIHGDVWLAGRAGSHITPGAGCNKCQGANGGSLHIEAADLQLSGNVRVDGGAGGNSRDEYSSFGCSAGDGGAIDLTAPLMDLSGSNHDAFGGRGGQGADGNGAAGADGRVDLSASIRLDMEGGSISTDGTLSLVAGAASIYAPFEYGAISELIAGTADTAPPVVDIVWPGNNDVVALGLPLHVVIALSDAGTGVKEVRLAGLGIDRIHSASEARDGLLELTIAQPTPPGELRVTAVDNKNQFAEDLSSGIVFGGSLVVAAGETFALTDDLVVGSKNDVQIDGRMVLTRGSSPTLAARSFTLGAGGRIEIEASTEASHGDPPPMLVINLAGDALIEGTVDLSGADGFSGDGPRTGEDGGHLRIFAESVDIPGDILVDGGDGRFQSLGFPVRTWGGGGGHGGEIEVFSRGDLTLEGDLSAMGGASRNGERGGCYDDSNGGVIRLNYEGVASFDAPSFEVAAGEALGFSGFSCGPDAGQQGWVELDYRGVGEPPAAPLLYLAEQEPNGGDSSDLQPFQALAYVANLRVEGSIDAADETSFIQGFGTSTHDIHDFYSLHFQGNELMILNLNYQATTALLGLAVYGRDPEALNDPFSTYTVTGVRSLYPGEQLVLGFDQVGDPGYTMLPAGHYVVAVMRDQSTPQDVDYELAVAVLGSTTLTIPEPDPIPVPEPRASWLGMAALLALTGLARLAPGRNASSRVSSYQR